MATSNGPEPLVPIETIIAAPVRQLHKACRKGTWPAIKVGRRWYVRPSDIERMLAGTAAPANDAAGDLLRAGARWTR